MPHSMPMNWLILVFFILLVFVSGLLNLSIKSSFSYISPIMVSFNTLKYSW